MTVVVERGSLEAFLDRRWHESAPHELDETPRGLCLLEGEIARRNLRQSLLDDGVQPTQAAEYSTIEDLATRILRAQYGRASILNRHLSVRLLEDVIQDARDSDEASTLTAFAETDRLTEDEFLEELYAELNEYYRCTDAGDDHNDLLNIVDGLSDQFAQRRSQRTLSAFEEIHTELQTRVDQLPDWIYLSRSHLVKAAREPLTNVWQDLFGHIDWVAVATVNVLDDPTLRLFVELANMNGGPDIHMFFEEGTRESLYGRLDRVGLDPEYRGSEALSTSDAGEAMRKVSTGTFDADEPPEAVDLVEAPDRRREVEHLVTEIRTRLANGTTPTDILVTARNVDQYRPIIEDVFTNNEIPYQVETRRPMAHLASYRFLKSAVDLIEASVVSRSEVTHTELTDPLRLGFCYPSEGRANEAEWPMPDRRFLRLEQQLHGAEQDGGTRMIEDWLTLAGERHDEGPEWAQLATFLEWIQAQASKPPATGRELRELVDDLLTTHIWCTATDGVRSPAGPAVDPARTDLGERHRTALAERVRRRGRTLETYYDHVQELFEDLDPSWNLVGQALGDVIGSEPFWSTNADGNAITIVDAGLMDFRDAGHLFVLGLSAEEFPIELSTPTFTHEALHEATARHTRSEDPTNPYLYYESRLDQYEQDLDSYVTALRACTDRLTLSHFYLDSEDDPVAWSPFVDFLDPNSEDPFVTRIRLDEWLPRPQEEESWRDTWARASNRDRLRSYVFHAADVRHVAGPQISQPDFQHLAFRTDSEPLTQFIEPRIERYTQPIYGISVEPDEPAFDGPLSLEDIVSDPVYPHEIDIFAQCQLKYYFYQFLFNFDREESTTVDIDFQIATDCKKFQRRYQSIPLAPDIKNYWLAVLL